MHQRREGRKGTQGTGRTGHGEQDGAGTQTDKASVNRKERNHTVKPWNASAECPATGALAGSMSSLGHGANQSETFP